MNDSIPEMRRCYSCKQTKLRTNFSAGSRDYLCRDCRRIVDKNRKSRSATRNDTSAARERKRRWNAVNKNPLKESARQAVRKALRSGDLVAKNACESCGESPRRSDGARAVQAHHDDYSRPLTVRWLCAKCHTRWHANNDAAMGEPVREVLR